MHCHVAWPPSGALVPLWSLQAMRPSSSQGGGRCSTRFSSEVTVGGVASRVVGALAPPGVADHRRRATTKDQGTISETLDNWPWPSSAYANRVNSPCSTSHHRLRRSQASSGHPASSLGRVPHQPGGPRSEPKGRCGPDGLGSLKDGVAATIHEFSAWFLTAGAGSVLLHLDYALH